MADHNSCTLKLIVSTDQGPEQQILAELREFIGQVYAKLDSNVIPKLDHIIAQNDKILASIDTTADQAIIDQATAAVEASRAALAQSNTKLEKTTQENK